VKTYALFGFWFVHSIADHALAVHAAGRNGPLVPTAAAVCHATVSCDRIRIERGGGTGVRMVAGAPGIAPPSEDVENDVGGVDATGNRLGAGSFDRRVVYQIMICRLRSSGAMIGPIGVEVPRLYIDQNDITKRFLPVAPWVALTSRKSLPTGPGRCCRLNSQVGVQGAVPAFRAATRGGREVRNARTASQVANGAIGTSRFW
jgi:hypothetical protein